MRYCSHLIAVLLLTAGSAILSPRSISQTVGRTDMSSSQQEKASVDSVVDFLLTSAVTDFHAHGPSGPLRFREVHVGHVMNPGAGKQYMLCGQFVVKGQEATSQWTPFVTIKTSGYEQYVGGHSADFCKDSTIVWENAGDVTSLLQRRFDAPR
ncbi:MAG TPA: hypothetical protein VMG09_01155 [Bacteroidota bacterium]|nr:hypothetical protein [Bacteroidota bacterium]